MLPVIASRITIITGVVITRVTGGRRSPSGRMAPGMVTGPTAATGVPQSTQYFHRGSSAVEHETQAAIVEW